MTRQVLYAIIAVAATVVIAFGGLGYLIYTNTPHHANADPPSPVNVIATTVQTVPPQPLPPTASRSENASTASWPVSSTLAPVGAIRPLPAAPSAAEDGDHYGEISPATGKPRTTYVQGYTRKDGTSVHGYYRSR